MQRQWSGWHRREFLKACAAATAGSVAPFGAPLGALVGAAQALAAEAPSSDKQTGASLAHTVKPEIGTGWRGHMFPGAVAPFGLVQLSPDTAGKPETRWNERGEYTGWDHCPGYYYPDNVVIGFSHTHVQGTGGGDLGDVLLMPVVEGRNWAWDAGVPQTLAQEQITELGLDSGWVFDNAVPGYRSFFTHDRETARAGEQFNAAHRETSLFLLAGVRCSRAGIPKSSAPSIHLS